MDAHPTNRILRAALIAALLAATGTPSARAQTSLADLESQLAQTRVHLASPGQTAQARLELLARCDEIEKRLIAAAPADDRVTSWLADRAACALDLAGENGSDIAALFGVPTPAQLRIAQTHARDALDLAKRAEQTATQCAARLETQLIDRTAPDQAKARAAAIESTLHILIDIEQTQRIPHLKALATVLLGACAVNEPTRDTAQTAIRELNALPPAAPELADARRVALGAAIIHASIGVPERAPEALKAAAAQFAPVAEKYRASVPNPEALKARLGLLRAGQDLSPRPRSTDAATEREIDALEAEARAAALLDRAVREPGGRNLLVVAAVRALLDSAVPSGDDSAPIRAGTLEKIAAAIPPGIPLDTLPPEATLALAITHVREAMPGDPLARNDAMTMLAKLADRADASAALRSQARWERAVLVAAAGDPLTEIDAAALVFRADPDYAKAVPAARRVAELFSRQPQWASTPDSSVALPEPWRGRIPALREALALLLRRDAANTERWRQESVRLSIRELAGAQGMDAVDRALELADAPTTDDQRRAAALATSDALWRALDQRRAAAAESADRADAAAAAKEWNALIAPATRTLAWSHTHDPEREPAYTLLLGEALSGVGDPKALSTLATLSGGPLDRPESQLWIRFRFAYARALHAAGDHAKALTTLREVADRYEGAPGSSQRDAAYWAAWAEMLAILQSQNTDNARSPDIRVQIKRLELLDPKLGGPPHAERIRQIRSAIGE